MRDASDTTATSTLTSAGIRQPPVGRGWIGRFSLAWLGFWMANLVPLSLLLPNQLAHITPHDKVRAFAMVNAVSAVVALVALPVFGTLSDRSRSRYGRRRIWIAGGSIAFAAGLVLTGLQTRTVPLAAAWSFSMIGLSAMTAGLTAVVADRVPERQRGTLSSAVFGPQALGVVMGIGLVAAFGLTSLEAYAAIAVLALAFTVPFVRHYREVPTDHAADLTLRSVFGTLRVDVRGNPDFAWAFGGRILVNVANSLGTCYLLYFLTDDLRVADPEGSLLALTVVYLVAGLLLTYLSGIASDRAGRRRIFVVVAALLQAAAGFLVAAQPTMGVAFVAAALLGGGFGAYMAVDQALVTQVLPDEHTRAKDLGIMNIATIIPPAVAPLIAGFLITSDGRGYPALFVLVGVLALLGAGTVQSIRSVP